MPRWASSVSKLRPLFINYFVIDQLINLSFQLVQDGSKEKQLEKCIYVNAWLDFVLQTGLK